MASTDDIDRLKQVIGKTTLTDQEIGEIIDRHGGNLNESARWVWRMKAAETATVVDVAESGSSRKLGDIFDHSLKMAQFDPDSGLPGDQTGRTRTRKIVRE